MKVVYVYNKFKGYLFFLNTKREIISQDVFVLHVLIGFELDVMLYMWLYLL